jgi:hypothetical protein
VYDSLLLIAYLLIQRPIILVLLHYFPELLLMRIPELLNHPLEMLVLLILKLLQRLQVHSELLTLAVSELPPLHLLVQGRLEQLRVLAQDALSLKGLLQLVVHVTDVLDFLFFHFELKLELTD